MYVQVEVWAQMIEHIRGKFAHEWQDRLLLKTAVSPVSLKVVSPRCSACKIGFVRTKPSATDAADRNDLCFSCVVRREIYERAQMTFPRAFRRKASSVWPFHEAEGEEAGECVCVC